MAEVNQQQVIDYIKGISVLELSQLVKTLETELGVSAAAAMPMMAMPMCGGGAAAPRGRREDRVHGDADRHRRQQDQRDQGRSARSPASDSRKPRISSRARPRPIKEGVTKDEAAAIKKKFEDVGAKVEIK